MSEENENVEEVAQTEELDSQFRVGEYDIEVVSDDEQVEAEPAVEADDDSEPTEAELNEVSKRVKKRIDKLTWKFNDERRKAEAAHKMQEEAIRFAKTTQEENENMRKMLEEGSNVLVAEIRNRTQADVAMASAAYTAALQEGDPAEIAKSQMALNKAQIEQSQAESFQQPQFNAQQQPGAVNIPQQPSGPVAQPQNVAPQQQPDPAFQGWVRDNSWFEQEGPMRQKAIDTHLEIEKNSSDTGTIVGSVAYYNQIDSTMRSAFPDFFGAKGTSEPAASPAPPVVAPASRSGSPAGSQQRKVQLTETQVNLAKRLKLPLEVYARENIKLNQEGN